MHIPYFADFYHICICKIDEITPLKRTAFLSPKQRYTFQIPPQRAASAPPPQCRGPSCGDGAHTECLGISALAPQSRAKHLRGFKGRAAGPRRCPSPTAPLPCRGPAVDVGQNPAGETASGPGLPGRPGTGDGWGSVWGVRQLEISRSSLRSPEGSLLGKKTPN